MNDLRRIEKELKEKQHLVPAFYKNPYRPTARLLKQVRRQANFMKTTSHQKYEDMIEKIMTKSPRKIKDPITHEQILQNIISELEKELYDGQQYPRSPSREFPTLNVRKKEYFEYQDKMITIKTLMARIHNEQTKKNRQPSSVFPTLVQDINANSCDSDRVMDIIRTCSKQTDQLEKMHRFVHQKQRNQRKRFASLHDQIGLLYMLE